MKDILFLVLLIDPDTDSEVILFKSLQLIPKGIGLERIPYLRPYKQNHIIKFGRNHEGSPNFVFNAEPARCMKLQNPALLDSW